MCLLATCIYNTFVWHQLYMTNIHRSIISNNILGALITYINAAPSEASFEKHKELLKYSAQSLALKDQLTLTFQLLWLVADRQCKPQSADVSK